MNALQRIRVLRREDKQESAKLVHQCLAKYEPGQFVVMGKPRGEEALLALGRRGGMGSEISRRHLDAVCETIEQMTCDLGGIRQHAERLLTSYRQVALDGVEEQTAHLRKSKVDKTIPATRNTRIVDLSASDKASTARQPSSS